jgi:hypothetical protein
MTKLLRCPFCGAADAELTTNTSVMYAYVQCNICRAKGPPSRPIVGPDWRETVALIAAALWNDAACRYTGWTRQ